MFARLLNKKFMYAGCISLTAVSLKAPYVFAQATDASQTAPSSAQSAQPTSTFEQPPMIDDDDDETWEERKQQCSFCRQFLDSPCKFQFRQWSRCVDKAKAENREFIEACQLYTRALLNCTTDNAEYFENLKNSEAPEGDDDDDDVDDDDDDGTIEEEPVFDTEK